MANLVWYNGIRITNLSLVPNVPGQIIHEIPSTGATRVFQTGAGRWNGTITFGRVDNPDVGLRIESFISSLNGGLHTTDIPLQQIKSYRTTDTTLENAQSGRYYNFGNRLVVIYNRVGKRTHYFPNLPLDDDSVLTNPNRIRIRLTNSSPILPNQPNNWGPWTLSFTEALS